MEKTAYTYTHEKSVHKRKVSRKEKRKVYTGIFEMGIYVYVSTFGRLTCRKKA